MCMRSLVLLLPALLFIGGKLSAEQKGTRIGTATRTSVSPLIDGELDEELWNSAPSLEELVMKLPVEGGAATVHSSVKIAYDNVAVYIGAMLYDDHPDSILHELGNRDDQGLNADFFRFV